MPTVDPDGPAREPADAVEADRLESRVVDIALSGKLAEAGHEAIAEFERLGLQRTVSRGGQLIRIHPDGREEVLEHLPPVAFARPAGVRLLEPK